MTNTILDCGHAPTPAKLGTGYATAPNGEKICYDCATKMEREQMIRDGKMILYLTQKPDRSGEVTNWTGQMKFRTGYVRKGRHNIARVRYDVRFNFDGNVWHGVQYGDDTQIVHCRRLKEKTPSIAA